ncbi:hypothetical protein AMTR_s00041p00195100 [Amborella trichopoda]|uniref:Uncharacterized protein n=1 Tax=Amborella trichopoda TaxID=13333 RepID=W1PZE7_AMBTC|nr:hypothetical protein AMTR_s00041p00195100 [Amborella trichopoda]
MGMPLRDKWGGSLVLIERGGVGRLSVAGGFKMGEVARITCWREVDGAMRWGKPGGASDGGTWWEGIRWNLEMGWAGRSPVMRNTGYKHMVHGCVVHQVELLGERGE